MSVLMLDPAPARELAAFAEQRANWWDMVTGARVPPGDDARYVRQFGSFRVVFSWTIDLEGKVWRHLSVSKVPPTRGRLPHPIVVYSIASWCGFTGGQALAGQDGVTGERGDDWQGKVGADEMHVVMVQPVPGAAP